MTMQHKKWILSLLVGILFLANASHAQQILEFSTDSGATFSNAFNVPVGSTLSVDVFLNEALPSTTLTDEGLIGFGMDVIHSTGFGTITNANPNPQFDFANHDVQLSNGFEWEYFQSASTGVTGSSIVIGSLDFAAAQAGVTTFTVSDRLVGPGFVNASWLTSLANPLDENIFGPGASDTCTFTITSVDAVPEPGGVILLPALACLFFRRTRKLAVEL